MYSVSGLGGAIYTAYCFNFLLLVSIELVTVEVVRELCVGCVGVGCVVRGVVGGVVGEVVGGVVGVVGEVDRLCIETCQTLDECIHSFKARVETIGRNVRNGSNGLLLPVLEAILRVVGVASPTFYPFSYQITSFSSQKTLFYTP
jgi:hypothetical protein